MKKMVKYGELTCRTLGGPREPGVTPELVVVLCHGYGASGEDLVPIGHELLQDDPVLGRLTRFVFPAAPLVLGGYQIGEVTAIESRAWWELDARRLELTMAGGPPIDYRNDLPPGLDEAALSLLGALDEMRDKEGIGWDRIVLAGFSQGGMLATEVALRLPETPAALCVFSGLLLCQERWREMAAVRTGMPALISHGRQDQLLSFAGAEALRDLLDEAGCAVEFLPFDGPHTIPAEGLTRFVRLLRRLAGAQRTSERP